MNENDGIKAIVADAIFKTMDVDTREKLIKDALASLLEVKESAWGSKSALQEAFDMGLRQAAIEIIREKMKDGETRAKVRVLVDEAFNKALDSDRDTAISQIAEGLVEALTPKSHR